VADVAKRVEVRLLPNWLAVPAVSSGGPTPFQRADGSGAGVLQFSLLAEYRGGKIPNPTLADLIGFARGHGERHDAGELVECLSGACHLGSFGSAVYQSEEFPRIQFWYLSNGRDFVLATHVCTARPGPEEIREAQQIVSMIGLLEA
jgi:hypothetical protein